MPPEERTLSSLETDIWNTHKSIIQKLYVEEKKTLKQVKETMELHHGFPSFPLSTYGTKLRDQLNLPKKLKKRDWPVVYRHYQRRQAEGKQTHMYNNNASATRCDAQDAATAFPAPQLQQLLSVGSNVASDSKPEQHGNSWYLTVSLTHTSYSISLTTGYEPVALASGPQQSFTLTIPFTESSGSKSSQSAGFYPQLSLMCLENIPWLALRKTLLRSSEPTPAATPSPRSVVHGVEYAMHHTFTLPIPTSTELSTQFDPLHTLAKVVYIISNNLVASRIDSTETSAELFNLLRRMPQRLVLDLWDSNLLSVQAAREGIARLISSSKREGFISFMNLVLYRPAWILSYGQVYLSVAVSKRCIDIVRSLLQLGVRADEPLPEWALQIPHRVLPAIFEAVACRDVECLELLVDDCDINSTVLTVDYTGFSSSFSSSSLVLLNMMDYYECFDTRNWKLGFHLASLNILLQHGANVDLLLPENHARESETTQYILENEIQPPMARSILEQCYYYDKRMYSQLVPFSSRLEVGLYRDETCLVAATGVSTLLEYLDSRPGVDATFLESVLAEQFFLYTDRIDSAVVLTLLEFGVAISTSTPDKCFTTFLRQIVRKAAIFGFHEGYVLIMQILLRNGATLDSKVLAFAVENEGTRILELMLTFGADFRQEGAKALYTAARRNNFAAVAWLLNRGVDINAGVKTLHYDLTKTSYTSIMVATLIGESDAEAPQKTELRVPNSISYDMTKYLMQHGAKLWAGSPNSGPYTALRAILRDVGDNPQTFNIVSFILSHGKLLRDLPKSGFHLLESSLQDHCPWSATHPRSRIFEFLWEHGAPVYPGAALARLIFSRAPRQLILNVMDAGADINAYTPDDPRPYDAIQAASH
ncbi:hypothetical protein NUW58_g5771 [Xylaria curta]|uniref:Uncharacterized protein n=1 Tax=Xylaria curta TaxID=42375 RepID=A0ACC1P0I5_9PEZI|nr:hypothetical protein NUW58_g5771 [Xylaria curta]